MSAQGEPHPTDPTVQVKTAGSLPFSYGMTQFAVFRISLGLMFFYQYLHLFPYADQVLTAQGQVWTRLQTPFPNLLKALDSVLAGEVFCIAMMLLGLMFALGLHRKPVAALLVFGWATTLNQLPQVVVPSDAYLGWVLLATLAVPGGEAFSIRPAPIDPRQWRFPPELIWGGLAVVGLSYTISGWDKLGSLSWRDGQAMAYVYQSPIARSYIARQSAWIASWPDWILASKTYLVLGMELSGLPLLLWPLTRKWTWAMLTTGHVLVLSYLNIAPVSIAMLIVHLFLMDRRWFWPTADDKERILFIDGTCALSLRYAKLLIHEDLLGEFKIAALQGDTARRRLPSTKGEAFNSMVLLEDGQVHTKSTAMLRVLRRLGGVFFLTRVGLLTPASWRDPLYDIILRDRRAWYGQHDVSRLETDIEPHRYLD